MMPVMEEVLLRFPHLGLQIFKTLDNSSLAKCRKVARSWSSFINYEELPWKRILQEYPCKDPQTKLLVSLITGQNDMLQAIFEAEKDNLKLKIMNLLKLRLNIRREIPLLRASRMLTGLAVSLFCCFVFQFQFRSEGSRLPPGTGDV